jgi:MoxR-like ATPase
MLKVVVDYPELADELTVVERALEEPVAVRRLLSLEQLAALQRATREVYVDPAVQRYAVRLATTTRALDESGLGELVPYVAFGASPRGPINLAHAARALALLRGREYALPQDVRELAKDVLRHRLVLTYRALAEEVSPDTVLDAVLEAVPLPSIELVREEAA